MSSQQWRFFFFLKQKSLRKLLFVTMIQRLLVSSLHLKKEKKRKTCFKQVLLGIKNSDWCYIKLLGKLRYPATLFSGTENYRVYQLEKQCSEPMGWHAYSFFNVWQDVLQTKLSKMTIPPEGASDGFANNFDQLKWRKTSLHLFGFSRTCQIWAEPLIAPFCISPLSLPPSSRKDTLQFYLFSKSTLHNQPFFPK